MLATVQDEMIDKEKKILNSKINVESLRLQIENKFLYGKDFNFIISCFCPFDA